MARNTLSGFDGGSGPGSRQTGSVGPPKPMSLWALLLQRELSAWARDGRTLSLWWRDDDARQPTPQLDRLLAISEQNGVPLTLAVIPSAENTNLAERIRNSGDFTVIQHGIDHVDRARTTERGAREMPREWDAQEISARVRATQLRWMPNWIPVFAPPWHDAHPCLGMALRENGFEGWSFYGGELHQSQGLTRIDVHLDVLRWKRGVGFRGERRFVRRLTELSRNCRAKRWTEPIGILTHHLQHDETSWKFLEWFIPWTKGHPAIRWQSLPKLLEEFKSAQMATLEDGSDARKGRYVK